MKSVDALVAKSDGPEFLLASLRSVLDMKVRQTSIHLQPPCTTWKGVERRHGNTAQLATEEKNSLLSPLAWQGIRDGTIRL
jgi:hypothetical protein